MQDANDAARPDDLSAMPQVPVVAEPAAPVMLQLMLLGPPALVLVERRRPLAPKDAALLAWLVLQGPATRAQLAALLWPAAEADVAAGNLRQRLFQLRRHGAGALLSEAGAVLALADGVRHDLVDPHAALAADAQALPGGLLGSHDYTGDAELAAWVDAARQRWTQRLTDALLVLGRQAEQDGQVAAGLAWARRAAALSPCHEQACALLMRLLAHQGDRAAALAEFARCQAALQQQLGAQPGSALQALAQQLQHAVDSAAAGAVQAASPAAFLPLALRRPPRTVGLQAVLQPALTRWRDDHVLLLSGLPGIGKSRLLGELQQRCAITVQVAARPGDDSQPWALAAQLLARLLPVGESALDADSRPWLRDWLAGVQDTPAAQPPGERSVQPAADPTLRLRLLAARLLAAQPQTGVAIDDLQFADLPSLVLIAGLLPGRSGTGGAAPSARWLLAVREGELPAPLQAWLDGLQDSFSPVLQVLPLVPADLAELLHDVCTAAIDTDAWARRLHAHCGGHPLYVLEVLRELARRGEPLPVQPPATLPLPRDTLALVRQRLARCDDTARRLASMAALCGPDFSAGLAQRLMGCSAAALIVPWQQLEALHILDGEVFSHELVRQAVLGAVPAVLAPHLRCEIAAALDDAAPARRAAHWQAGGRPQAAALDFARAARQALQQGAPASALTLWQRAAACHASASAQGAAQCALWHAGHLQRRIESATAALDTANSLVENARTPAERARALELLARARLEQHDDSALDAAERACAEAVRAQAADDGADAAVLADAPAGSACDAPTGAALVDQCRLAVALSWTLRGRHASALKLLALLRPAAGQPERLDALAQLDRDEQHAVALAMVGRRRASVQLSQQMLQRALTQDHLASAWVAAANLGVQLGYLGCTAESQQRMEQAIELARRAGIEHGHVLVDEAGLAASHGDAGRFALALQLLERCAAQLRSAGYQGWAANADIDRANLLLRLGRADLAQRLLTDAPDAPAWVRAGQHLGRARVAQWRAAADGSAGGGPAVLAQVETAAALLAEGGAMGSPYVAQKIALELARARGPAAAAEQALRTLAWTRQHQHVALGWLAAMVRTEALLVLGDPAAAAQQADMLARQMRGGWQAFAFYLPQLWLLLCRAWQAVGRTAQAQALAGHAQGWLRARLAQDVPELYIASFAQRNPINRALLDWR